MHTTIILNTSFNNIPFRDYHYSVLHCPFITVNYDYKAKTNIPTIEFNLEFVYE